MAGSAEACLGEGRVPQSPRVLMDFVGLQIPGGPDLVRGCSCGLGWDLRSLSVGPIERGLALHSYDVVTDWDPRSLSVGPVDLLSWGGDWVPQNCADVDSDRGTLGSEQGYWEGSGFVT